ncbi:DNA topoisomerase IB [Sandaracinobacteroides saxicola]|uniref:DNA topoisomerase n=1 Tax=Sandaracinobacteroides saxicola TaxID=2759707 RepID=A0A7G5IF56_9SPHN|nr:DNA topoisomerase IB [Sandaracinobacteroides saxicola]QMW21998.1 DNA topoisomerase IB [Sandaracinobacteroides saxicola]
MASLPDAEPALHFSDLDAPGFTRVRRGSGFHYRDAAGRPVRCRETIARLNSVALPPAYRDAWYCADPDGHIQAVGIDARGRRQYRYHPAFRARQELSKFEACVAFGEALPRVRRAVAQALETRGLDPARVIAAVVRLLDLGRIRVGNERYARDNRTHGATTLRGRHAAVKGARVRLRFRGKHGIEREVVLSDRALASTVRRCQELPGQHLFACETGDGVRAVTSADVNAWLQGVAGAGVTAKAFRTWWASTLALAAGQRGAGLREALDMVAAELGNTPAMARKSYVHPAVVGWLREGAPALRRQRATRWMSADERTLLAFLSKPVNGTLSEPV